MKKEGRYIRYRKGKIAFALALVLAVSSVAQHVEVSYAEEKSYQIHIVDGEGNAVGVNTTLKIVCSGGNIAGENTGGAVSGGDTGSGVSGGNSGNAGDNNVDGGITENENPEQSGDEVSVTGGTNGEWYANLDPEKKYTYTATAEGYREASGEVVMSDDGRIVIPLKKLRSISFQDQQIICPPGTEIAVNPVSFSEGTGELIWSSGDENVAKVVILPNGEAQVHRGDKYGRTWISASGAEDEMYAATEAASFDIIFQKDSGLAFVTQSMNVFLGESYQNRANVSGGRADGCTVIYSGNENYVDMKDDGSFEVKWVQIPDGQEYVETEITAHVDQSDDCLYAADDAVCTVRIYRNDTGEPQYTNSQGPALNMYIGQTWEHKGIAGAGEIETRTITYTSSNPAAVVAKQDGTIEAVGAGDAVITITWEQNNYYKEQTATYAVKVYEPVAQPQGTIYLLEGETKDASGGWYTGAVTVKAKTGYELYVPAEGTEFTYGDYFEDALWQSEAVVQGEGTRSVSFYARNEVQKTVTKLLTIPEIKIDSAVDLLDVKLSEQDKLCYRDDVALEVKAKDSVSLLKEIRYAVLDKDGTVLKEDTCRDCDGKLSYEGTITIPKEVMGENGDIRVQVTAKDQAGNDRAEEVSFYVNSRNPEISVDFGKEDGQDGGFVRADDEGKGYFNRKRTALVSITCDERCFDENAAEESLLKSVTLAGEQGEDSDSAVRFDGWTVSAGDAGMNTYHTEMTFEKDGRYTWKPVYTDKAGNDSGSVQNQGSLSPNLFVIDRKAPTGTLTVGKNQWDDFWDQIGVEILSKDRVEINISGQDDLSPIYSVRYLKTTGEKSLSLKELSELELSSWSPYTGTVKSEANEQLKVYARIEDYAGNVLYLGTDKLIVDCTDPEVEISLPESAEGYYGEDVKATVTATDPGDLSTGIRKITYSVKKYDKDGKETVVTDRKVLYLAGGAAGKDAVQKEITIPAGRDTSEEVKLSVTAEDAAGRVKTVEKTVKIDTDAPQLTVTQPNPELALYNQDVTLAVNVVDENGMMDSVSYVIRRADGSEETGSCDQVSGEHYQGKIIISSGVNGDVTVEITAEDKAGNPSVQTVSFRINTKNPEIVIDFNSDSCTREVEGRGYFPSERKASVTVTCDSGSFDEKAATEMLVNQAIRVTDAAGNELPAEGIKVSAWKTAPGKTAFEDQHTATVTFRGEGNYTWTPSYVDLAGNTGQAIAYNKSVTPTLFTVDRTLPVGTVTVEGFGTWESLPGRVDFAAASNQAKSVTATAADAISPISSVRYFKTSDAKGKTVEELNRITDWKEFQNFTTGSDEQAVIYVRIEDCAGNVAYLGTNGIVIDSTAPGAVISLPASSTGIYTGDVNVAVSASEPVNGGTASGISSVDYEIYNGGSLTGKGNLYTDNNEAPSAEELVKEISRSFSVPAEKNNSNNVEVRVIVKDHAGNQFVTSKPLMIDVTLPKIEVSYDNNSGDTSFGATAYFRNQRVAVIRIQERNFDENQVKIVMTNKDGAVPIPSAWSVALGGGNGDGDIHTATIPYAADGKYTFDISFQDKAGNAAGEADYGNSLSPREFVVDTTPPVVEVSYDKSDFVNENYLNTTRTATVTIREHNFEESRIALHTEGANGEASLAVPISGWHSVGDAHTATLSFEQDGYYKWSLDYTDMAGNQAEGVPIQSFYVDTTLPELSVSGVRHHSANNTEENIGFVLECRDANFDVFSPRLTTVVRDGNDFCTKEVEGSITSIANGKRFTVENLPNDGIYTLYCEALDKAGNQFTQVQRLGEDGRSVTEECEPGQELLQFSVNREGSVFWLDEPTAKLVNHYYVQNVEQQVCIQEACTDPLESYRIELNDSELEENKDYTVKLSKEEDSWYLYTFCLASSLFEEEGENRIVVESVDKTKTTEYSDVKNLDLSFVVDQTPPAVTLSGLEDKGRYQTEEQTVTAIPTDDGGKVQSVKVEVFTDDGAPFENAAGEDVGLRFAMEGEKLEEYLAQNKGQVTFTVPEGVNMTVRVMCRDCAVDAEGKTNEYVREYKKVTVSPNALVIWFANKGLLRGIVGGVCAGSAAAVLFVWWNRKRKRSIS